MSYKTNQPVNSHSWQIPSHHQPDVTESEGWWGWAMIDLLLDVPVMLAQYLLRKVRNGLRRIFWSGMHGLSTTGIPTTPGSTPHRK
jgi:hypothetical protein